MCKVNHASYVKRILPQTKRRAADCNSFFVWTASWDLVVAAGKARVPIVFLGIYSGGYCCCLCLPRIVVRHNVVYITFELSHGQTNKTRPKNAGVKTDWHPQSSSRFCFRRSLQRESLLRSQRPSPGSLRDAAPSHCRKSPDRRCRYQVRRLAAYHLPRPGCIPASRSERLASQAAWTQRKAQAVGRGPRLCEGLARHGTELDHRRLCPSRSQRVRFYRAPSQSGAGIGRQKKTAPCDRISSIPEAAVAAYEELRRKVIQSGERGEYQETLGVFMRRGLATWAQIWPACVSAHGFQSRAESPVLDRFETELVRLVAGLILSTRQEDFLHARIESYPAAS